MLSPHFYDEGHGAFSDTVFNTSIAPCVNICIQYMRSTSIVAKANIEKTPVNGARIVPKRQTPNIISSSFLDVNPTFTSHSSDSNTPVAIRVKSSDSISNKGMSNSNEKKSASKINLINPAIVSPGKGYSDTNLQSAPFSLASPNSPKK